MHPTAQKHAQQFFDNYCSEDIANKRVLEVGSYNVCGSIRGLFKRCKEYVGLDQEAGPGVDLICDAHEMSLEDNQFDIIVSTSCFEHDDMFWLTFLEMCRVIKPGGHIYILAPSAGWYHAFPVDNWRFFKDSWSALAKWGVRNNYNVELLESFVSKEGNWKDSVGIFTKK